MISAVLLAFVFISVGVAETGKFAIFPRYTRFLKAIPEDVKKVFYFRTACPSNFVALTFDDGPVKKTKPVIDLLKEKNIPATFFVVCKNLTSKNVQLYKDPLFEIGMHSFNHGDYRKFSNDEIEKDIDLCVERFSRFDLPLDYFRPGYGVVNSALSEALKKKQLKGILWNIDSFDWDKYKGERLISRVVHNLSPGSIILFHDRVEVEDLKKIIDEIQKKNFKIVSLKTILEFPAEYP